jgi:alkylhydroperoxidase family enzyme
MSRIPPVEHIPFPGDEQPAGSAAPAPPGALASSGISATSSMSTLFRTMAHRPDLARRSMALLEEAMRGGTVEPQLKELVAVRVSQVNHCFY